MPAQMIQFTGNLDTGVAISLRMLSGKKQIDQKFKLENLMGKSITEDEKAGIQNRRAVHATRRIEEPKVKDTGASSELQELWARIRARRGADEEFSSTPVPSTTVNNSTPQKLDAQGELAAVFARRNSSKETPPPRPNKEEDAVDDRDAQGQNTTPVSSNTAPNVSSMTDFLKRLKQTKEASSEPKTAEAPPSSVIEAPTDFLRRLKQTKEASSEPKSAVAPPLPVIETPTKASPTNAMVVDIDEAGSKEPDTPAQTVDDEEVRKKCKLDPVDVPVPEAFSDDELEDGCKDRLDESFQSAVDLDFSKSGEDKNGVVEKNRCASEVSADMQETSKAEEKESQEVVISDTIDSNDGASTPGQSTEVVPDDVGLQGIADLPVADESGLSISSDSKECIECQVVTSFFSSDEHEEEGDDDDKEYVGAQLTSMWQHAIDIACQEGEDLDSTLSKSNISAGRASLEEEVEAKQQRLDLTPTMRQDLTSPMRPAAAPEFIAMFSESSSVPNDAASEKFYSFISNNCSFSREAVAPDVVPFAYSELRNSRKSSMSAGKDIDELANEVYLGSADRSAKACRSLEEQLRLSAASQRAFDIYSSDDGTPRRPLDFSIEHGSTPRHATSKYDIFSDSNNTFLSPQQSAISVAESWPSLSEVQRLRARSGSASTPRRPSSRASTPRRPCSGSPGRGLDMIPDVPHRARADSGRRTVRNRPPAVVKEPQVSRRCCMHIKITSEQRPESELPRSSICGPNVTRRCILLKPDRAKDQPKRRQETSKPAAPSRGPQISRRCCTAVKAKAEEPRKRSTRDPARPRSREPRVSQRHCCIFAMNEETPERTPEPTQSRPSSRVSPFTAPERKACTVM